MRQFENQIRGAAPFFSVFLLCTVMVAQNFLSSELFPPLAVFAGVLVLVLSFGKIKHSYLKLVWPLLGVFLIGIVGSFNHAPHDILRDVAFALVPFALIFIGYWFGGDERMWPLILKIMVLCGFVLAVIHLSTFVINPELLSAGVEEVRLTAGGGGVLVTIAMVLGLFQYRLGVGRLSPKYLPRFIFLPVLFASFVLSYSRTDLIVAIIFSLALGGALSRINLRSVLIVVVLAVSFVALIVMVPEDETGTLRSKLARSATEVAVYNYEDMADINANWRGFETYRALVSFSSGSVAQQIFGQGFGALVDLGFVMDFGKVDGVQLQYIPILHNGYAYILIKTGLLGLACYVFFYASLIRYAVRYSDPLNGEQRLLSRLLLGCVLSLIMIMYVVGGMAQTAGPALVLLLGYLTRRLELLRKSSLPEYGRDKSLVGGP